MSRRHHGNRPHRSSGPPRPSDSIRSGLDAPATAANPDDRPERTPVDRPEPDRHLRDPRPPSPMAPAEPALITEPAPPAPAAADAGQGDDVSPAPNGPANGPTSAPSGGHGVPPEAEGHGPRPVVDGHGPRPETPVMGALASCTAPQLRRFIKSRPYVPMHELRRRFGINGTEDDVSSIDLGARRVYVGLPPREGSLLGELLRGGDIGYELSLDPRTPIVIGLYPMRPVARS
jgi:hypothetical protein